MDVFKAIEARRSVRSYKSTPIEDEKLKRILEAGRLAPSATNRQPWHFIVVTDSTVKESLRDAYSQDWFVSAPVILIVCAEPSKAWVRSRDGEEYWKVDAAIAMQNMVLCAAGEGLGTCWIAAFNEQSAKSTLRIPPDVRVVAMTPIGYPGPDDEARKEKKPLQEIVHYNKW